MPFVIMVLPMAAIWAVVIVRYAIASSRYERALCLQAGFQPQLERASSPLGVMRAVDRDLADYDRFEAQIDSGQLGDSELRALLEIKRRRVRDAVSAMVLFIVWIGIWTVALNVMPR